MFHMEQSAIQDGSSPHVMFHVKHRRVAKEELRMGWHSFHVEQVLPACFRRSEVFHMEQSPVLRQNSSPKVLFHVKHLAS